MNYFAISALVNLITSLALFIIMMAKLNRSRYDKWFAGFCLGTMVWSTGYFFWQISDTSQSALFWTKFLMGGAIIVGLTYFQFVMAFLGEYKAHRAALWVINTFFALMFVLNFGPWIVQGVEQRLNFPFWPIPGYVFHIFLIVWGLSVVYSTYLLGRAYTVAQGLYRRQIRLLFFGMFIAFFAGSTNYLLWYNVPIAPVANILVAIYPLSMFYAIFRYKFFNVKVFAAELFALSLTGASIWQLVVGRTDNLIFVIALLALIVVAGVNLIRSVVREVQQREQLEKLSTELEKANDSLKVLDQARAEFISIASHQLRTPPATIKWYLAAIRSGDFGPIPEAAAEQLKKTEWVNNSLISLIEDLLNVSRIERGKMEFTFEPTDILKIVQMAVDQLLPQAESKKLKFTFKKPRGKLPLVVADAEKLRQVVNNLIDNAIKYTKAGKVAVELTKTDEDVMVKVTDTGRGVKPEQKESIFQKFDRGGKESKDSMGLGLGLYVAKVIMDQHHGRIYVESAGEGKGSTFIMTIPLKSKLEHSTYDFTKKQGQTPGLK